MVTGWRDDRKGTYFRERDEVQEAFDNYGGHGGADDCRVDCPLCGDKTGKDDHRASLSVNMQTGFYKCHKCGTVGRLEGFEDDDFFRERPTKPDREAITLPRGFQAIEPEMVESLLPIGAAAQYAHRRTGDWGIVTQVGIGMAANRLIVPIRDSEGKHLGHVARVIPELLPAYLPDVKYVNPKGFRREELLFNESALDVPLSEYLMGNDEGLPVMVTEGVFDALPHWPLAVACLGKPTHVQETLLERSLRPLAIVLDGDAWETGKALAQRLCLRGVPASWVELPPNTDPGDYDRDTMRRILAAAAATPGQGVRVRTQ